MCYLKINLIYLNSVIFFRVKNVKNLRVVDASVMPIITTGNTQVPVIMIAEKAADMIKESINCSKNQFTLK